MNAIVKTETGALSVLSEPELLQVLQSSLYPGANPASIKLVLGYCKAAGLDPMQKPVHIVPMWDNKAGQMRDVVMPGVNLYRTQASRSQQMAGISDPTFGPMLTEKIGGQEITFPEWCRVTVRRVMANGSIAEFTATEYWVENYAVKGGKEKSVAPNAMWTKRPRGQIAKCAEAQALRKAFPEIAGGATAEEMEGKAIAADDITPMTSQTVTLDPAILANARSAADKGREAFAQFWKAATPDQRRSLKDEVGDLQRRTDAADKARTVDAEPVKPTVAPGPEAPVVPADDPWLADLNAAEGAGQ